jgi:hypothetical protein
MMHSQKKHKRSLYMYQKEVWSKWFKWVDKPQHLKQLIWWISDRNSASKDVLDLETIGTDPTYTIHTLG